MSESDEREIIERLRATPELFEALRGQTGLSELQQQQQLREQFPAELVQAALTLQSLRQRGQQKFTRAAHMWFDRTGLEQSTPEQVARYKATRFHGPVIDACCGIGGDTIALAGRGEPVTSVDTNPANCLRTQLNAEVYEVAGQVNVVQADINTLDDGGCLLHVDPDRRAGKRGRSRRIEDGSPNLDELRQLMERFRGGAIKLSPAGNFVGKFPGTEIELISLDGECKEATVWFGELGEPDHWRATVLPAGATLAGDPLSALSIPEECGRWLLDPDPSIVRAGLVDVLCEEIGAARLDAEEEYLTAAEPIDSPFVQTFEVLAELPKNDRAIRSWFRNSDFGQVEIKCRHVPIVAEQVRRKLPLPGDQPGVLVFARLQGRTRALACRRVTTHR